MLCDLDQMLANGLVLSAIAVGWTMTVAVPVVCFGRGLVLELRSIERGREAVGRFEVTHEVTLVVQSNLVCDLLHAEEARLQQILRALHSQQSQVANRRHADVRLKDVTKTPNGKVYGLSELAER